jgi:hypothetical protein
MMNLQPRIPDGYPQQWPNISSSPEFPTSVIFVDSLLVDTHDSRIFCAGADYGDAVEGW